MTADPYKTGRRLGQWKIGRHFVEDCRDAIMLLQTRVLILDATLDWPTDTTTYRGIASEFDIVERGCEIPLYVPVFTVTVGTRPFKIANMRWARPLTDERPNTMGGHDSACIDYTGWYPKENYTFPKLSYLTELPR